MNETKWTEGAEIHGFRVQRVVPLAELNSQFLELEHGQTGARYIHIASSDDNNLFAVGFRTPPPDSTGVPHILEHTVLCGSRRYPVHDPFFAMLKRSLSTFMNALTADDWTLYPFASQNRTDFYNLMGVYLDAVFHPLLRESDFRQEGHRLEFNDPSDPDSALTIQGVVYNEMKGAMSDPYSLLGTRMAEALYPTVPYGHNAGGDPAHIPDLTWDQLRAFHAACYHPSNAYFFSYGDLPLGPHLQFIAEQALVEFERADADTEVPDEVRFSEPRSIAVGYPMEANEDQAGRTMVQVGWLTCNIVDHEERLAMELLSTLLLGNPAAPLHKALLDSKLGTNLAPGSGYNDGNRETTFAAGLQGTDPESAEAIQELVLSTLEKVAREGFSRERIEAAMQQLEFAHQEVKGGHYPHGLLLLDRMMGPWIHGGDPARALLLGGRLDSLRKKIETDTVFEDLIRRQLLDNPHRVTLTLRPDPFRKEQDLAEEAERLERIRSGLTAEDRQTLARRNRELAEAQDAREDPACLPTLTLSDIPREERRVAAEARGETGVPVWWFPQPTNGIGYVQVQLEAEGLGEESTRYLPLFCVALSQVGAAGQSYTQMAERISASTGGIRAGAALLEHPENPGEFHALAEVTGKALKRNREKLLGILQDLLSSPDFGDRERLHTVFNQLATNLRNSIPAMGHRYAARMAAASLSPAARLRERWSGVEFIRFAQDIAKLDVEAIGGVGQKLRAIADDLLVKTRIRCGVTGEERLLPRLREAMIPFLETLKDGTGPRAEVGRPAAKSSSRPARVGLIASVPVSYVARVFPCVPFTHQDTAGLLVLGKLLRSGYLHREIRERGGAYGGVASYAPEAGLFSLLSYRDPHLTRTLGVFDEAARWAARGAFEDREVEEAILSVFSDLDTPLSPGGKGAREFANIRQGLTWEMRQRVRQGILATNRQTLARLAEEYLVQGRSRSAAAAVANEETLTRANQELGAEAFDLHKI